MKKTSKVVKGLSLVALAIAGAAVGAVGHALVAEPKVSVQEKVVNQTVEVIKEVQVPVNVTVEKLVEVDNEKLETVLQFIYDNEGKIEYVTEDLKDSEVAQIADRVVFVNDIKALALNEVKSELKDLVDKEEVGSVKIDDKDVERVRFNDDADEIVVEDIDFEDNDALVYVSGTFEQDDVKYKFVVEADIKDGEVDDLSLDSLEEA